MCNLYATKASAAEIAALFKAKMEAAPNVGSEEIYPGGKGLVVREEAGERILQSMTWGFPMKLKYMRPDSKPKAVNNIAEIEKWPWNVIAPHPEHRCLIPLTGFCEAEGEKGSMTRTWFSVAGQPIFAWAGMWKNSPEWGPVYSGYMTNCNGVVKPVHKRMPVLLHEEDYDRWLRGSVEDILFFRGRCFPDELTQMERTAEPWFKRKASQTEVLL